MAEKTAPLSGATVIPLDAFRQAKKEIAKADDWTVPLVQIYRMRAFYKEIVRGTDVSFAVALDRPAPLIYTGTNVHQECGDLLGNATWEPIDCLDPKVDSGRVIVRHHDTEREADAYLYAHFDNMPGHEHVVPSMYTVSDGTGCFTIWHRKTPRGTPDHLLIFAYVRHPKVHNAGSPAAEHMYYICHPDGSISTDPAILHPKKRR